MQADRAPAALTESMVRHRAHSRVARCWIGHRDGGGMSKCGWQPVDGSACPRCEVDVVEYFAESLPQVFGAMVIAVYPILFHWRWGQTLGKMAVDIRVVTCRPTPTSPGWLTDSGPLTLGCAALRQLASLLSSAILGVGYLMAGLRRDKRALHDLIAGTRVERLP
jgi:uncharacterized RDD family membrane protein YckC